MANTDELLFYFRKYQQGDLALAQIAERLNMTPVELREKFNSLSSINESKQALNE